MSEPLPTPPPGFDNLTVAEQIEYVQALWDRIAASPDQVPVPDWHLRLIEERRAQDSDASPRPWPEVRQDIEAQLRRSKE